MVVERHGWGEKRYLQHKEMPAQSQLLFIAYLLGAKHFSYDIIVNHHKICES